MTTAGVESVFRLRLDYDFNMPAHDDGRYRVLPHKVVLDHQAPGDLVIFGDSECEAEGIVIGRENHGHGDLLVIERRGMVVCR